MKYESMGEHERLIKLQYPQWQHIVMSTLYIMMVSIHGHRHWLRSISKGILLLLLSPAHEMSTVIIEQEGNFT